MQKNKQMDMCNGPLLGKIISFTVPLILTSLIQLLFNAADIVVVGRFAGKAALSAVGSTGALVNLCINLFIGLSAGAGVTVAQCIGAKDKDNLSKAVHTSIALSLVAGLFLLVVGPTMAGKLLTLMSTPDSVLPLATLYLKIYFLGMPGSMLYNFGAAILRSSGDTKRPLYYLSFSGVINVVLNLVLVICFDMSVAGVAIATVISQLISAILVIRRLTVTDDDIKLDIKKIRFHSGVLRKIVGVGVPAGIQSSVFSLSNVIIQSSINAYDSFLCAENSLIAGNSAAMNIEGFIYVGMNAFHHTALTFTGQNLGAKKIHRFNKVLFTCLSCVAVVGIIIGISAYALRTQLLSLYIPGETDAITFGCVRMMIFCLTYFICGMMDTVNGALRGMGRGIGPMAISLFFCCAARVLWVLFVFTPTKNLITLYLSYPITWSMALTVQIMYYVIVRDKLIKKYALENTQ